MTFSLSGRLTLTIVANVLLTAALVLFARQWWPVVLLLAVFVAIWSARYVSRRITRTIEAVGDGVRGFRDGDFSVRLVVTGEDEIADLMRLYNEVGEVLRAQRNDIYQKELLLDTILQRTPVGVVLINAADRIIYSNAAARELFAAGRRLDGSRFAEVVGPAPETLREALHSGGDSLFTLRLSEQEETFHLSQRVFHLNTQQHRLVLLERLTPELRRAEVTVWKKAIRLINHELNNTIAPISSLFHSARRAQELPAHRHKLGEIYETIEERLTFLRAFLESYAQFARLPEPSRQRIDWNDLLDDVRALYSFRLEGNVPAEGYVDPAQLEQVLINLLKNAHESGSDPNEITITIQRAVDGTILRICDRGRGMDEATMRQALLPFYTTKAGGTGLGLALCTEIIEAHGGRLNLSAREGGGTVVTCWLPQ
ncbi:MAG TPA: ATP-binding protein [Thermoanaerobaculia bacterium]